MESITPHTIKKGLAVVGKYVIHYYTKQYYDVIYYNYFTLISRTTAYTLCAWAHPNVKKLSREFLQTFPKTWFLFYEISYICKQIIVFGI